MHTRIGTIALAFLAETGTTAIRYDDTEAQRIIAARAGWAAQPIDHLRSELLRALERDERFAKAFVHVEIEGQTRKVRLYHPLDAPPAATPTLAVALPLDPWRRRLFLGALLDLDPHDITDAHAASALAVLPEALMRLPPRQRERIITVFGLGGQPATAYAEQAATEQRGRLTIRSSVRLGMHTLKQFVRPVVFSSTLPIERSPDLPGDSLFWERVDRRGECWLWMGTLDNGYAVVKRQGKKQMATRYVYELYNGHVPDGHRVTHTCEGNTARCVRPHHLIAVLPSDIEGSPLQKKRSVT
jgi:hypothetical protein